MKSLEDKKEIKDISAVYVFFCVCSNMLKYSKYVV